MVVTVIMPVYNAERFLDDSIGSLLNQTNDNWKLICVDDGSSDKSAAIIEYYAKRDSRITLYQQSNAGASAARAKAIQEATSEYVAILDQDDAYAPDYIDLMIKRAMQTDADVIVPDAELGYKGNVECLSKFASSGLEPDMIIDSGKEAFSMTIPWNLHGWIVIKSSLAKKYYTAERGAFSKFNSDEYLARLMYLKSEKVALCKAVYRYRMDENSVSRKPSLLRFDFLVTLEHLVDLAYNENISNQVILRIFNDYYATLSRFRKSINELPECEREQAKKMVKRQYRAYKRKMKFSVFNVAPLRTKIKFLLSFLDIHFINA